CQKPNDDADEDKDDD
ncbi:unnamed protein product, partial [Rotaria magnacalcarata]